MTMVHSFLLNCLNTTKTCFCFTHNQTKTQPKQLRYDVANLLHLDCKNPAHEVLLKSVLSELAWDTEWDESNSIQRAFKNAGEKRYAICHALLKRSVVTEGHNDSYSSSVDRHGDQSSAVGAIRGSSGSGSGARPESVQFKKLKETTIKNAKTEEAKVPGLLQSIKKLHANFKAKGTEETETRATDINKGLTVLGSVHDSLLCTIAQAQQMDDGDTDALNKIDDQLVSQTKKMVDAVELAKIMKRKMESYMTSVSSASSAGVAVKLEP